MDLLRKYIWLLVILGMIFVTMMISLIFILINKCISKAGKHRVSQFHKSFDFNIQSNKYQERNLDNPPLPPRTQFLKEEAQSYENLAEVPDYEEATNDVHDYEQNTGDVHDYEQYTGDVHDYEQNTDDVHDYEQNTDDVHDYEQNTDDVHDYEQNTDDVHDYEQNTDDVHDYEQNTDDVHDYEQNTDDQFDYVKVEGEEMILPPPPYKDPDLAADNTSTEDYDDIGGEGEDQDYDDVA